MGCSSRYSRGDDLVGEGAHVRTAEFGLGLSLELGIGQFDRDDGRHSLANVIAREVAVPLLQELVVAGIVIDGLGEGRAEALEVHAALLGVDVVRKAHDHLGIPAVPLHRYFHLTLVAFGRGGIRGPLDVDGLGTTGENRLALVEEPDEVDDATRIAELIHTWDELALVSQDYLDALVEEGRLLQMVMEGVVVVSHGLEDLVIRPEGDGRTRYVGAAGTNLVHLLGHLAARQLDLVDHAITLDLGDEALREGIDDGDADTVQAARHLVGVIVELAARMEYCEDHLKGGLPLDGMHGGGDATPVVDHSDRVVGMDGNLNLVAETSHGLINRVVDDLPHQMVEASL